MKTKSFTLRLLLIVLGAVFSFGASAQSETTLNQPQFGKQTVTVASDQTITYYDPYGEEDIKGQTTYNGQSMVVFKPAEAGMSIQIDFENVDMRPYGSAGNTGNYPAYLNIYNGEADAEGSFTWATTPSEVSANKTLPTGNIIEMLSGTNLGAKKYYSTTSDGALSVGYLYVNATNCSGFKATVKCVKLENMSITGAGSKYDNTPSSPKSKMNIPFATAYINTTGMLNAPNLTAISFKMTQNEGAIDPLAMTLYTGDGSNLKNATALDATVAADGDGYTISLSQPLGEGTNEFTLVGNMLGTAQIGAKAQVDITKIATSDSPEGISPFTAGTSVAVENPAVVLMNSTPQTITVMETPLNFYDEGGIDGPIQCNTNGTVTFVPGVDSKKVMVDFSKIAIFAGSYYNQEIRIYNGQEVNEANRVKTFQNGESGRVRSTSDDGALTVVLFSDASTVTDKDGFEAVVSLFTPSPMTVNAITATQPETSSVAAGDENVQMLSFVVNTENTEPALTAGKFSFTTNGTNEQVAKAKVYYTESSNTFSTTTLVGEATVSADAFEIEATNEVTLIEGDNYFWLAYDINEEALNGQKVDAAIVSATFSGTTTNVSDGSPAGERVIDNIILSYKDMGTLTKKVNGTVTFKTRDTSEFSTNYEAGTDDRINVFVPLHNDKIIEIDFTKFGVYYASSSYGTRAKFIVYSGQGTSGEVLWQLSANADQNVGPGKVLRSKSADGAITVVFNPNYNYSTYTSSGWSARVSEYQSKPMVVDSVIATQTSSEVISAGAKGEPIIGYTIFTSGDQSALTTSGLTLNLKGNAQNISKVYVYTMGSNDSDPATSDTPIGTADVDAASNELAVVFNRALQLEEGNNYFRIHIDLSADAAVGSDIDLAVKSVKIGDQDVNATKGDPEGSRNLKNIYNLKSGSNGEILVSKDAPYMFYDDGGADGKQSTSFTGTVTFAPKEPGCAIRLTFKDWSISGNDYLYIYQGGEEKATADLQMGSSTNKPESFGYVYVSTTEDGKLTVKYTTRTYAADGFAIEVSAYEKKPLAIASVKTTAIAPENVTKGYADAKMLRMDITVEGDYDPLTLKKFSLDVAQSNNIAAAHVYATDTLSLYGTNNLYGTSAVSPFEVEGSYTFRTAGVYKFWLTYDISQDAEVGSVATAKLTSITIDDTPYTDITSENATTTVKQGASGTYTVGDGGDYYTIQQAVNAVSQGLEGPVVINVKPGKYNERVIIPHIPGTSATNTLTLQSSTGDYGDVHIYHDSYTSSGYSDDQMANGYGVVTVNGCDWLTVRGFEISTTDKLYDGVFYIKNNSQHVTLEDCYLHAPISSNIQQDINIVGHYAANVAYQNNDYFIVRNNIVEGGYYGINMGGTGYVALPKEVGGVIEGNIVRDQGSKAIYSYDELGVKILNNRVENTQLTTDSSLGLVDITQRYSGTESLVVSGNVINIAPQAYMSALYLRDIVGTAEAPAMIVNNQIIVEQASVSSAGIKMGSTGVSHLTIANNSVLMKGGSGPAFWTNARLTTSKDEPIQVINNVFQSQTGNVVYNLYNADNIGRISFSNNVAFTEGTNFGQSSTSARYTTYDEWAVAVGETDSYAKQLMFLGSDILEPATDLDGDLLKAKPLAYVTTDINGKPRAAQPTIGAYEYVAEDAMLQMNEGFAKVTAITDSTAVININADGNGSAYAIVKNASDDAPTVDEVVAASQAASIYANATTRYPAKELQKDNHYIGYIVLKSLRGTLSDVIPTEEFVASSDPVEPEPDELLIETEDETTPLGGTVTLMAIMDGGKAPYTVTWYDNLHEVIKTETLDELPTEPLTCDVTPTECNDYIVVVKDVRDVESSATARVIVTGEGLTATFENLYLEDNSYWNAQLPDRSDNSASFVSGSYRFNTINSYGGSFWSGFAYSNSKSTAFTTLNDQYNSAAGGGYNGSDNFAVFYYSNYGSPSTLDVLNSEEGDTIRGFYLTNNAYAYSSMMEGDSYAKTFEQGDWFKLTVRADNGNEAEYYLADFRSEKEADHYVLDTWEWFDLSALGKVKKLRFEMTSSDTGSRGMNTPAYFCMDNLNGDIVWREGATINMNSLALTVGISGMTTLNYPGATTVWEILNELPSGIVASISSDGQLTISATENCSFDIYVKVSQRGRSQYIHFPVSIASGIDAIIGNKADVEGIYTVDGVRLAEPVQGINIIRYHDGKTKKVYLAR